MTFNQKKEFEELEKEIEELEVEKKTIELKLSDGNLSSEELMETFKQNWSTHEFNRRKNVQMVWI